VNASAALVEGTHAEGNSSSSLIFKAHYLMVNDVVVTLINASAVVGLGENATYVVSGGTLGVRRTGNVVRFLASIDLFSVVRAGFCGGTTHIAVFGRTLGLVCGTEMRESSEAVNACAFLTDKPLENVDIVAALCEKHRGAVGLLVPVAAGE
jgi:hypothetical protein